MHRVLIGNAHNEGKKIVQSIIFMECFIDQYYKIYIIHA